jgi:hypothetical protein
VPRKPVPTRQLLGRRLDWLLGATFVVPACLAFWLCASLSRHAHDFTGASPSLDGTIGLLGALTFQAFSMSLAWRRGFKSLTGGVAVSMALLALVGIALYAIATGALES